MVNHFVEVIAAFVATPKTRQTSTEIVEIKKILTFFYCSHKRPMRKVLFGRLKRYS